VLFQEAFSSAAGSDERELMIAPGSAGSARQAFEVLTQEHLPRLYAFALRLTGGHAAAEDLVQETYLKAYQAFHQLIPDRNAHPWLMKILLNTFRDHVRRECHAPTSFHAEDLDAWYQASWQSHRAHIYAVGPEEQVIARSFADEVAAALANLSPDFRTAVLLADMQGYSYPFMLESVNNYIRYLLPEAPYDLQSPDPDHVRRWFHGRLDFMVEPPDLRAEGYQLLGTRLGYFLDRLVAEIGYEGQQHRLSIFMTKGEGIDRLAGERVSRHGQEFFVTTTKGYTVVAWRDGPENIVYSIVADLSRDQLLRLAFTVAGVPS
jgi:RNA polymerase sigma-70 factor, ECF subfamily